MLGLIDEQKDVRKMLKKIICLFLLGLVVLTGCSTDEKSEINDKVLTIDSDFDYAYDLSNNLELSKHHNDIALVEITDIGGTSNYNDKLAIYVDIYTYGKAVVKAVYKGNLKIDDKIAFTRLGGKLSYNEWKKGLLQKQVDMLEDAGYTSVVSEYEHDIPVEKNKTYLVFLDHTSSQKDNEYAITGFAYGMREIDTSKTLTESSEIMVKNNFTDKYEPLSSIVVTE